MYFVLKIYDLETLFAENYMEIYYILWNTN